MIIGLQNKIMNIFIKQLYSLKFQHKLVEEQETLSIYHQNCRKKHLLRQCPADVKSANTYVICAGKNPTKEIPFIPGLKEKFEGENLVLEPLCVMGP